MSEHECGDQCVCLRHRVPVRFDYEAWYGQHQCPRESEHGPVTMYDADPTLRFSDRTSVEPEIGRPRSSGPPYNDEGIPM